jgi:hypothetical protein
MEVGQGPNWGCSAKEKKILINKKCMLRNQLSFLAYTILTASRLMK